MGLIQFVPVLVFLIVLDKATASSLKLSTGSESEGENESKGKKDWYSEWKMSWKGQTYDNETRAHLKEKITYSLRDSGSQNWKEIKKDGSVPSTWQEGGAVKILVHGYAHRPNKDEKKQIREQNIQNIGFIYGKKDAKLNIIVMDWMSLALGHPSHYNDIVQNVPFAGQDLAELVINLVNSGKIKDLGKVHIIGFSMGAHVAGKAGHVIQKQLKGKKVGRITGLDPMGPGFVKPDGQSYKHDASTLDKEDAAFVDVIHCNMGKHATWEEAVANGQFGSSVQSGHADFYPNGGEYQRRSKCAKTDEHVDQACSQRKCNEYYADSISSNLVACRCDDWQSYTSKKCTCTQSDGALMGESCPSTASGRLYLRLPPVAQGQDGTAVDDDDETAFSLNE